MVSAPPQLDATQLRCDLGRAIAKGECLAIRTAIEQGQKAGLTDEDLSPANEALATEERKERARAELSLSVSRGELAALRTAVELGQHAGLADNDLSMAKDAIAKEERKERARAELTHAACLRDPLALLTAFLEAQEAGLQPTDFAAAKAELTSTPQFRDVQDVEIDIIEYAVSLDLSIKLVVRNVCEAVMASVHGGASFLASLPDQLEASMRACKNQNMFTRCFTYREQRTLVRLQTAQRTSTKSSGCGPMCGGKLYSFTSKGKATIIVAENDAGFEHAQQVVNRQAEITIDDLMHGSLACIKSDKSAV